MASGSARRPGSPWFKGSIRRTPIGASVREPPRSESPTTAGGAWIRSRPRSRSCPRSSRKSPGASRSSSTAAGAGTDVLKALALGAAAVAIGRPYLYAPAVSGADGVRGVVNVLRNELEMAMALTGRPTIASIDRSLILPAARSPKG